MALNFKLKNSVHSFVRKITFLGESELNDKEMQELDLVCVDFGNFLLRRDEWNNHCASVGIKKPVVSNKIIYYSI